MNDPDSVCHTTRLSDVLGAVAKKCPHAACFVAPSFRKDHSGQSLSLSYGKAARAQEEHGKWLNYQSQIYFQRSDTTPQIVLAYLSCSNQVDFLLSVLAATEHSGVYLPALLNARWSPAEMAVALQPNLPEQEMASELTFLIHDGSGEMSKKAVQTKLLLSHKSIVLELPKFAKFEYLLASSAKNSMMSSNFSTFTKAELSQLTMNLTGSKSGERQHKGNETALIIFTSGTTSGSKGVLLSHRAILIQALAKLLPPCKYSNHTVSLASTVAFYHVGGLSSMLATWLAGGCLCLPAAVNGTSFEPSQVLESIMPRTGSLPVNTLVVVPAMLYALQKHMENPDSDVPATSFPHVSLLLIGGQSASSDCQGFCSRIFPHARLVQTYACTEAASSLTFLEVAPSSPHQSELMTNLPNNLSGDCVGFPPPHVRVNLLDLSSESQAIIHAPFVVGRIATSGPHTMNGYWRRGAKLAYHPVPSLMTNDLGFWDGQGRLYFYGRATDSVRTGGETVMAQEVERVLIKHRDVEECAVFGLPDEQYGEVVCCALVCRNRRVPLEEIRNWCQAQGLTGYKRPRRLFHVTELPRNASGKVLKFRLVDRFRGAANLRSKL